MAKTHLKGRPGNGAARQRSVAAAARAASKRAERARTPECPPVVAGRTVVVGTDGPAADEAAPAAAAPEVRPARRAKPEQAEGREKTEQKEPRPKRRTGKPRPVRGRTRLFRGLPALVTLAAVTAAALLGWEYRQTELTAQARTEATAVARKAAPKILSYDYRNLEKDFAAADAHLTGSFRDEFARTTKKVVTPTAEKYHGVVKATIAEPPGGGAPAVSVVSASPEEVVVLMFMNQVTESKKLDKPRMDLNRVRMTMTATSDGWKVSAVDAL